MKGSSDTWSLLRWFVEQLLARWEVLIVFGLVLLYVLYFIRKAKREISACDEWSSTSWPNSRSHVLGQIRLFLEEAERWRLQGISVPMTDYSDRIDSIIEGLTDHIHNSVNLFLLVGLAGTFFGMGEFANSGLQAMDPRAVLNALRTALGHSFPIGFFGLCLTIVGHPIATYYESRLRESAKNAVNHALRLRTATFKQDAHNNLLDAVKAIPQELGTLISNSQSELLTRFESLLRLPDVIESTTRDSLSSIRELYTNSRKEWLETVSKLNQYSTRMATAIETLEQPITKLTTKIDDISTLVASTQEVVKSVLRDAEKVSTTVDELQKSVQNTATSLHSAAEEFRRVPTDVKSDLSQLHDTLLRSISGYYETLGMDYAQGIRSLATAGTMEISSASKAAATELIAASNNLRVTADAITPELRNAIQDGADHLHGHLITFNEAFARTFPAAVESFRATLVSASEQIEVARKSLEGIAAASKLVSESGGEWKKATESLAEIRNSLQQNSEILERSANLIKSSADEHVKVPAAISSSAASLQTAAKQFASRIQNGGHRSLLDRMLGRRAASGS